MQQLFFDLVQFARGQLKDREVLLANFAGEVSDFMRLNRARVRQAMTVRQAYLTLTLIDEGLTASGARCMSTTVAVTGDATEDKAVVKAALEAMRTELLTLPADPHLSYSTQVSSSERRDTGRLPSPDEALDAILQSAKGADLVGIYASGPIFRGFANSLGQQNWHAVDGFNFEWSLYHSEDKAVKSAYASGHWNPVEFAERIASSRAQLAHLGGAPKTIEPGIYRAYLAPQACDELLWMLNWEGVSAKAQQTKQSVIQKLVDGAASLSSKVTLRENTAEGLAPAFDEAGFVKPGVVELIRAGVHAGALVSPRTAQEYGLPANGANDNESMESIDLAAGSLPAANALEALDTGVYISNLWYLNFSDHSNARVTGMTRFATFWVEQGQIAAPLNVMRFDDSLYRMLGDNLIELTRERDWIVDSGTYGMRSVDTSRCPGMLMSALTLTL